MPIDVLTEADVRLITVIGFLGSGAGLWRQAHQIFDALAALRPYRDFPYIGLATLYLNQQKPDQAVRLLEQVRKLLAANPDATQEDQAMLAAFHAVALQCAQRTSESQQILQSVLQMGYHSNAAIRIARAMLGIVQSEQPALENP